MKKIVTWILIISICISVIVWGVIGVKILDNNYDFLIEAYIGYVCFAVMMACIIYLKCIIRCQNCKKILLVNGKYCYHCGNEIKKYEEYL